MATAMVSARRLRRRPDAGRGDDGGRRGADRARDRAGPPGLRLSAARAGARGLDRDHDRARDPDDPGAGRPGAAHAVPPVAPAPAAVAAAHARPGAAAPAPGAAAARDRHPTATL